MALYPPERDPLKGAKGGHGVKKDFSAASAPVTVNAATAELRLELSLEALHGERAWSRRLDVEA